MRTAIGTNELIVGKDYTSILLNLIRESKKDICVLMFAWRWSNLKSDSDVSLINQALLQASRRGVKVYVFCNFKSMSDHLNALGINAKYWQKRKLMHAKGILFDSEKLLLGSHNLTESAMNFNVEVSALLYDVDVCIAFKNYFKSLWQ